MSLGIVAACAISVKKAGLPPDQGAAIADLLRSFGLPTRLPPKFPRKKILDAVKFDKKFEGGKIRFIVTPRIGAAYVADNVTLDDIRRSGTATLGGTRCRQRVDSYFAEGAVCDIAFGERDPPRAFE